ncbi:MBL fold metallo-hydrolase [Desulforamulus aeronauticus]|uniref:7,8-dihydropterin-6-yl-methyl-4-(Beta-D-ribofuranosyl)aminobenzene 5'-phosphate synthase n=1 Tax=Desulforamulus aeronauticus DSM 10349 TaxID=1121421 RepID=A0A1M6PEL3_9FIRM|nr:MBL fold metallo-hydrolase [Desulforamulus aeronauticus]SHK06330.1 7,8-dihydropterin-6-yl-methyl-4-(beta-D-ribofuranosyl)aminobenzene 5'-phosphate synthase [Desulforamulus aeronauticus DSM 10349]
MKLTVLVDNNTLIDRYFLAEPGLSFFIQTGNKKILFDTGYSDIFIRNAEKMGINLKELDYIVLSHGHMDHTWGLEPLIRLYTESRIEHKSQIAPTVVAHPLVLETKVVEGVGEIGSIVSKTKLSHHFKLNLQKEPVWLTENLVYLGEIPRMFKYEANSPMGSVIKECKSTDDYLMDDTGLVFKSTEGLVIIVGCSHAGICNIIEYAKKICHDERVVDVVGGFHLLNPAKQQLDGVLKYLETAQPKEVHACHCTDLHSKIQLSKVVNLKEVGVGLSLQYNGN